MMKFKVITKDKEIIIQADDMYYKDNVIDFVNRNPIENSDLQALKTIAVFNVSCITGVYPLDDY